MVFKDEKQTKRLQQKEKVNSFRRQLYDVGGGVGSNRIESGVFAVATIYSGMSKRKITRKSKKSVDR